MHCLTVSGIGRREKKTTFELGRQFFVFDLIFFSGEFVTLNFDVHISSILPALNLRLESRRRGGWGGKKF
jgi:hypothetical protein